MARRAEPVQKEAALCNIRRGGKKAAMDAINENVNPTAPNRRSSRLKGTALDMAATAPDADSTTNAEVLMDKGNVPVKRKAAGRKLRHDLSPSRDDVGSTFTDEDAQSDAPSGLDEIRDLRQQLQQEKGSRYATY